MEPDKAKAIVLTVAYLHNFLRSSESSRNLYSPPGTFDKEVNGVIVPGSWRADAKENCTSLLPVRNMPRRSADTPKMIRQEFGEYFVTNGHVLWQEHYA